MSISRKAAYASSTFALLVFGLLFSAREARADAIVISGGQYTAHSPFLLPPRYISWAAALNGDNFSATSGELDGFNQQVSSNCPFPCAAGSTFSVTTTTTLFANSPARGHLQVNGQDYNGWFTSTFITFSTDSFTIPVDAAPQLSLLTQFTMQGTIGFTAYDLQTGVQTPDIFSSSVIGSGYAYIDLAFVQLLNGYQITGVRYYLQPPGAVPEPATMLLLGTGLAGAAARGYRRRRGQKREAR